MFRKRKKGVKLDDEIDETDQEGARSTSGELDFIARKAEPTEMSFVSPSDTFNPYEHKAKDVTTIKTWQACLLAGNMILTGTLFDVPHIFKQCGIISSVIVCGVVLLLCIYGYLSLYRLMFKVCKKERIDYISYGKLTRYAFCGLPKCKFFSRTTPYLMNIMIVFSLLIEMSVCVLNGTNIFAYLLNITYGVDLDNKMAVCVLALPYFLAVITIPRLPLLTVFSIVALISLVIQMAIQLVICCKDIRSNVDVTLFGDPRYIPRLVSCLLVATGSFPVILAVEKEMKTPKDFIKTLGIGNICLTISNFSAILYGILGYTAYGNAVQPNFRENLSAIIPRYIMEILYLTQLLCVFPLFGHSIMSILMHELLLPQITCKQPIFVELPIRYFWVLLSFVIAELCSRSTYLTEAIYQVNALILTILSFLIPGILGIIIRYPKDYGKRKILLISDIGLIVLSLFFICLFGYWTSE